MRVFLFSLLVAGFMSAVAQEKTVYQFSVLSIDGEQVSLEQYKGKVLLIVNTASFCGYTKQYAALQQVYSKLKDKGFEILAFPCNDFGKQEPHPEEEIKIFCTSNFGVTFPLFSKISVKGKDMHPLYNYLTNKSENGVFDMDVRWNFQKYLVNREGKVVQWFEPGAAPDSKKVQDAIQQLL